MVRELKIVRYKDWLKELRLFDLEKKRFSKEGMINIFKYLKDLSHGRGI